jgi:energy-converting hydrogenase Eha subunit E
MEEALAIGVIIGAPLASSYGFKFAFVENILVRITLLGLIIFALRKDHLLGLLTFLAVFSLFLERNHNVVLGLPDQKPVIKMPEPAFFPDKRLELSFSTAPMETDIHDNIPHLQPAPKSKDAAAFFKIQI